MNALVVLGHPARVLGLIASLSLGAVGAALVTQHVFEMQPCPWCILQRLIYVSIALAALLGLAWRSVTGRTVAMGLVALLAAAGIATALWQHFVAAASDSCNLTLADRIINGIGVDGLWPEVFAPRASCADAAVTMLGVPYEFWSLTLFALLGGAVLWSAFARRRNH